MSYGLSLPGDGTGFFIDQNFPGLYMDASSYTYVPPATGNPPGIDSWVFYEGAPMHPPTTQYRNGDLLFIRPGEISPPSIPAKRSVAIFDGSNLSTPCHTYLYKSLVNHPKSAGGYGLVVWTSDGRQSFNSNAHQRRVEVAFSGITSVRADPLVPRAPVVFRPSDSIANYYCLANTAQTKTVSVYTGYNPPMITSGLAGSRYLYNGDDNSITFEPDMQVFVGVNVSPARPLYYCIARILG